MSVKLVPAEFSSVERSWCHSGGPSMYCERWSNEAAQYMRISRLITVTYLLCFCWCGKGPSQESQSQILQSLRSSLHGLRNSRLWFHFIGCGDGSSDNLFGIYLEREREGSAPNFNFPSSLIRFYWTGFARPMHSTPQFDKATLSKCVSHVGFDRMTWALRGIPL